MNVPRPRLDQPGAVRGLAPVDASAVKVSNPPDAYVLTAYCFSSRSQLRLEFANPDGSALPLDFHRRPLAVRQRHGLAILPSTLMMISPAGKSPDS